MSGPFGETVFRNFNYLREGVGIGLSQVGGDNRELTISATGITRSVIDFGAVGDGVTDDGAALNRAADWLRDQIASGNRASLDFLDLDYVTTQSLNFTAMAPSGPKKTFLLGSGARVIGKCTGKAIFDCLGSSNLTVAGILAVGDPVATPRFGFQIGRYHLIGGAGTYRATSAGGNTFLHCGSEGTFTGAGKYNNASEVSLEIGCNWYNDSSVIVPIEGVLASYDEVLASPFSHISDSGNHFNVQSDYVTVTQPVGGENSFLNQTFISCSFRRILGGSPLYMSFAQGRVTMTGCYAACINGDAVIIGCNRYNADGGANYRTTSSTWNLNLHIEADSTDETTTFRNAFRYVPQDDNGGTLIALTADNFTWIENKSAADEALFRMSDLFPANSRIVFRGLHMNVDSFHGSDAVPDGGAPDLGIFYPGTAFRIATTGYMKLPISSGGPVINDTGFYMSGDFFPRSATLATTVYPKGSYRNANSIVNTGSEYHKGRHVFWGDMDTSYTGADFPPSSAASTIINNGQLTVAGNDIGALGRQFSKWIGTTYQVPNDGTDAAATLLTSVAAVAQSEIMRLRPGTYLVNSAVTQTSKNPTWVLEPGAVIDATSSRNLFVGRAKPFKVGGPESAVMNIIGGTTVAGISSLLFSSYRIGVTGATSGYEAHSWWIGVETEDPSSGTGNGGVGTTVTKAAVGLRVDGRVAVGNMTGRIWAGLLEATIPTGAEGHGTGLEIDLDNGGAAVSDLTADFQKVGIKIVTKSGACTYAYGFGSGTDNNAEGNGFYYGLYAKQDALVDDPVSRFLKLPLLFEVDRTGYTMVGKGTAGLHKDGVEIDPLGRVNITAAADNATLFANRYDVPGAAQNIFNVSAQAKNTAGTDIIFGLMKFISSNVTPGAEAGEFVFTPYNAGAAVQNFSISDGIKSGSPTGSYKGVGTINIAGQYFVNGTKVVDARSTGWTAFTGATNKATAYDPSTITLAQLAERVSSIQIALTTHGLIGA
jgi:hypothetical protein